MYTQQNLLIYLLGLHCKEAFQSLEQLNNRYTYQPYTKLAQSEKRHFNSFFHSIVTYSAMVLQKSKSDADGNDTDFYPVP